MRRNPRIFYLVLIFPLLVATSGMAATTRHRPWLSRSTTAEETDPSAAPKSSNAQSDPGHKVVSQALRYKGTRYRYGGTTKHGMDCSGLVARVWSDLKMKKIPRASSALYNSGKPVHLAELRPGDLVFFKNTYK